jgi:hypothetical protein
MPGEGYEATFGEVNTEGEEDQVVDNGRGCGLGAVIFRRLNTASENEEEEIADGRTWTWQSL